MITRQDELFEMWSIDKDREDKFKEYYQESLFYQRAKKDPEQNREDLEQAEIYFQNMLSDVFSGELKYKEINFLLCLFDDMTGRDTSAIFEDGDMNITAEDKVKPIAIDWDTNWDGTPIF